MPTRPDHSGNGHGLHDDHLLIAGMCVGGPVVEQVLMPVLVMAGAGLLVLLVVPLGLLLVPGVHYARRGAVWLVPTVRRCAVDLAQRATHLRYRVARGRVRQTVIAGAMGCALAMPAFAVPVRDLGPERVSVPLAEAAGGLGSCCGTREPKPAGQPATNQVRDAPSVTGNDPERQTATGDGCIGNCDQSWQDPPQSTPHKSKKKKKSKG